MIRNKLKKAGIIAASLMVLVGTISTSTYAANRTHKAVTDITFGKVSFYQNTEAGVETLDDCYKGKVFDKDGKEVNSIDVNAFCYDKTQKLYTKDGDEISYMARGEIVTVDELNKMKNENVTVIDDVNKIGEYANFDYKLPTDLPKGYEFKNAEYEKTSGITDNKEYYTEHLTLNYEDKSTGNNFSIDITCSEQPFTFVNNKKMEQIKVNDNDGVLYENGTVSWVINDVSYTLTSEGLNTDENLEIADSVK